MLSACTIRALVLIGVKDGKCAIRGAALPILEHLVSDALQAFDQFGARLIDGDTVLGQFLGLGVGLFGGHFPAAGFSGGGGFHHGGLGFFVQTVEHALVHHDDVLRHPCVDRAVMRYEIPSGGIHAGGGRGDHRFDLTGGEGLRDIRGFDLYRCGTGERRELFQRGVIGAETQAVQIVHGGDFAVGIKTLRRPRHRKQRHQALFGQQLGYDGFLRIPEFLGIIIAGGDKGLAVETKCQILVRQGREEEFANRHLTRAHGVLDLRMGKQRTRRVDGDVEPAIGGFAHVIRKLHDVLGVEGRVAIGRGHVPAFGMGRCGQADSGGSREEHRVFHMGRLPC